MSKDIRLNTTHYFITKIPRELEQIKSRHSSDNELKDFMKLYKDYAKEPFPFLVINTTLLPDKIYYKMTASEKI